MWLAEDMELVSHDHCIMCTIEYIQLGRLTIRANSRLGQAYSGTPASRELPCLHGEKERDGSV